jgi:predicted small secreted protein
MKRALLYLAASLCILSLSSCGLLQGLGSAAGRTVQSLGRVVTG